ncbi:MAG TPA: discoidin domain-containing protein [Polyangiaceae bacterium]|nr:discoidin domain-containing protein [Polyangiaceae bacterium]
MRWGAVDSVLRIARAAEVLARQGAPEPALILYRDLVRAGIVGDATSAEDLSVEETLGRYRAELADWLRAELGNEVERVRSISRRFRRMIAAAALIALAVVLLIAWRPAGEIGEGAHFTVSSPYEKTPASGELPKHGFFFSPPAYFFHTTWEAKPWISIDLGRERVVKTVRLLNRLDCCRERARGVTVEISRDGKTFRQVARHPEGDDGFVEWTASFSAVSARFVRIVGTRNESLHLADVRIFGS